MTQLSLRRSPRLARQVGTLLLALLLVLTGISGLPTNTAWAIDRYIPGDPGDDPPPRPIPNGFRWVLETRFGDDIEPPPAGDGLIDYDDSWAYVHPTSIGVTFNGCLSDPNEINPDETYRWTFDGVLSNITRCTFTRSMRLGSHTVELTISWLAEDGTTQQQTYRQVVEVKDVLIVSLGDSFASGQGNPDIPRRWEDGRPARWQVADPCYRSALAGPAKAASALERNDPHTSVTFLHFACSGATINHVVTQQIPALAAVVGERPIDTLIVSTGGNDMHFADIIYECAAPPTLGTDEKCFERNSFISRRNQDLQELPGKYDVLAEAIQRQFAVRQVLFTEYPNMFRHDNGAICPSILESGVGRIDAVESAWLEQNFLDTLNNQMRQASERAAQRYGAIHWQYVDGVASAFTDRSTFGHGYCADDHWFVRAEESMYNQGNEYGTLHPNNAGHQVYATRIASFLERAFYYVAKDPFLQRESDGRIGVWLMDGMRVAHGPEVDITPPEGWKVGGIGSFNADGEADIVLQHQTSRQIAVWLMDGVRVVYGAGLDVTPGEGWKVVGTGHFNGDGKSDIVLQHEGTKRIGVWLMDGMRVIQGTEVDVTPGEDWKVVGTGSFNGDGKTDIVLQHQRSLRIGVWLMDGTRVAHGTEVDLTPAAGWKVVAPR